MREVGAREHEKEALEKRQSAQDMRDLPSMRAQCECPGGRRAREALRM